MLHYMVSIATNHGISVIYHSNEYSGNDSEHTVSLVEVKTQTNTSCAISDIYHSEVLLISTTGVVYNTAR